MTQVLSITEARRQLMKLSKQLEAQPETTVQVTQHGKPVLAVLSWDFYDSLTETLEVISDDRLMKALRRSTEDIQKGRTFTLTEVAGRHGLKP
jgi:prevent-host-death family protein